MPNGLGAYERGRSVSAWPSWQQELASQNRQLPVDPLNRFSYSPVSEFFNGPSCTAEGQESKYCPETGNAYQCAVAGSYCVRCPQGYDGKTCYNSDLKRFYEFKDEAPMRSHVYGYRVDPSGSGNQTAYELFFNKEYLDIEHKVAPSLNQ